MEYFIFVRTAYLDVTMVLELTMGLTMVLAMAMVMGLLMARLATLLLCPTKPIMVTALQLQSSIRKMSRTCHVTKAWV